MASYHNNLVKRYVSLAWEPEALAQNFFEFRFHAREFVYVFPPPKLIWPCLKHLNNCNAKGVVIWPMWPSIPAFSKMINNYHLPNCVLDFNIIKSRYIYVKEASRRIYADNITTLVIQFDMTTPNPLCTSYTLHTCVIRGCSHCVGGT